MGASAKAERLGVIFALLAATGFSLKAVLVKLAYAEGATPLALLSLRMLYSLPAFLVVAARSHGAARPLPGRERLALVVVGLLGYYGASILDFLGLQHISPGLERLILFTYPTMTLLVQVASERRRPTRAETVAVALTYAGVGLAFSHDLGQRADRGQVMLGGALVFGAALSFTFYLAGSARLIAVTGAARFTALAMLVSTAATLVHFAAVEPLATLAQPPRVHALALVMAAGATVLPVFLQSAAIARLGAGRAAVIGTVGPMLTVLASWAALGEQVGPGQLLGAALVAAGVLRISRSRPSASPAAGAGDARPA